MGQEEREPGSGGPRGPWAVAELWLAGRLVVEEKKPCVPFSSLSLSFLLSTTRTSDRVVSESPQLRRSGLCGFMEQLHIHEAPGRPVPAREEAQASPLPTLYTAMTVPWSTHS